MSHGVVCKYHYRGKLSLWLTSVTVWLILREGVAKSPCRCGSIAEIYNEMLGEIIKNARIKADMTVETLANKVGVTERFIYRIENEGKKPSYEILYKLIRELAIVPDQIFFPEKQVEESEMGSLVRMLYSCDERSIQIIKATIKAALESQSKE